MAGFKVDFFKGMRPRISAKKLSVGDAVTAQNIDLGAGDILPYDENATEQALNKQALTIYKYNNNGSPVWFEWEDYVDVVLGPVKDDSLERVYYVGDTTGNGAPKLTSNELADQGGGGPYPEAWWYIGVPAPGTAPTVTPPTLPEDKDPADRIAKAFKTDEFQIDRIQYTVYPGTGTDNDTWRLNSAATGSIAFDVLIGTAFRVKSVINNNRVTLESATEPGITMRTANSDKSTINDWHPVDEQGSTKEADFMGWRVPPGMQVTIPGHELNVGDVIVVSAINGRPEFYSSLTQDHYAQDWTTETTVNIDGTDEYIHRNERISASATSGDTQYEIQGTFYYDVDRASSTVSELEDRTYVYTYVNSLGEEGPPSPPSAVTPILDGDDVLVSGMELPPTIGYDITKIRLYRSNSTEAGTEYQFVKEIDVARSVRDAVKSIDLGEVIPSTSWDPPPSDLTSLASMPNGMLVGFKGKNIYFCDPYRPHAWPADYDQAIDYEIVGAISFSNSIAVITKGWPYIITGSHPRNANVRPIKINQAGVSKQSIATDGDRVYYGSPDGIVEISAGGAVLKTEGLLTKKNWQTYSPSTMVSGFFEGKYYGFYDFDVDAVDPVITAELSGTITNADEDDIIEGANTILITLQNDNWVAAGTAFDNQRQNIIDGLDAATSQTLGWNNLIRDTALDVTDVTRVSDTIVQIDLPAVPGYAISTAEVITCTIPASALLLSNSAVVAGSTFTIKPQEHQTTVTLSGTLDGAAEADIVTGGNTIIMTLTNDTWVAASGFTDALVQELINGLVASTDELNGWNDTVPHEIDIADVVRTSDDVVTITLDAIADYSVTASESISATVPHELLTTKQNIDVASANSLGIIATGVPSAIFSGTVVSGGVTENEIVAGSETIIITLTNDTWIAAGTGPIGTTAQSDALIDAIISAGAAANGWNNEVLALMDQTDLVRTSSTVATITMPAVPNYSIASDESISCTIPAAVLTGGSPIGVSNTFSITAQAPVTATMGGTLVSSSPDEIDIVNGGLTITLTLSDDTWVAAGTGPIGSTAVSDAIIDGIVAASSPTNGWNNRVLAVMDQTDLVRTSDTVATITMPAVALYDIASTETITATIPASALSVSASAVVASPTADITVDVPASITVTGTADGAGSRDIIAGGKTIILTASDDTWVASGAVFNAQRQNIIDGLDAASSPAGGWNNKVRDVMGTGSVVRTNDTVVTITLPATADYDVNADEVITVTVPSTALTESSIPVVGNVTVDISAFAAGIDSYHLIGYGDGVGSGDDDHSGQTFYDPLYFTDEGGLFTDCEHYVTGAYSPNENQWVARTGHGSANSKFGGLYTIAGTSFGSPVSRTTTLDGVFSGSLETELGGIFRSDSHDVWIHTAYDDAEWSSNGTSWTNIRTAIENGYTGAYSSMTVPRGGIEWRDAILYGGTSYLYCTANVKHTLTESSFSGFSNELIRSADISGANTPATNWSTECDISCFSHDTNDQACYGTGNGLILCCGFDGTDQNIAYMTHGGTTFSLVSNPGSVPQIGSGLESQLPDQIIYGADGIWVAVNADCNYIYCDTGSGVETNGANWGGPESIGSGILKHIWYDKGSSGSNGWGWLAILRTGIGEYDDWELYQSDDPTTGTWTQLGTYSGTYSVELIARYAMMDTDFA